MSARIASPFRACRWLAPAALILGLVPGAAAEWLPQSYYPPADRALAVAWLGKMGSRKAVPLLVKLCDDPDGGVRSAAVEALGALRDPAAAAVLTRMADDARLERVAGVTRFGTDRFAPDGPARQEDYNLRHEAQWALLRIPERGGRREARHAIALLKGLDPAAVGRWSERMRERNYTSSAQGSADNRHYSMAYHAIEMIRVTHGPEGVAALLGVLGCGNENLELAAARILCDRPAEQILPRVRALAAGRDVTPLTLTACLELTLRHQPDAAAPLARRLVERLKTADDFERFPHRELAYLRQALTREDAPRVQALRESRSRPEEREAVGRLIAWLEGRRDAEELLGAEDVPPAHQDEVVRYCLKELGKSQRDWATFRAAWQLGRLRARGAVPELLRLLQYPPTGGFVAYKNAATSHQPMAGWALVRIGDPAAVPKLREIGLDGGRRPHVRAAALLAYARLAREKAVPDLKEVLREPGPDAGGSWADWDVDSSGRRRRPEFPAFYSPRDAAAWGLSEVGGEGARGEVRAYLASGRPPSVLTAAAFSRVDRDALDGWSLAGVGSADDQVRGSAIDVRFALFPATSHRVAQAILAREKDSRWGSAVRFLRRHALADATVTETLIDLIEKDGEKPTCNRRLRLLDALGRQGGPRVEKVLLHFAEHGRAGGP